MFDQSTLSIKLNGKSFDRSSDTDTSIGYGKGAFARRIVEERATSINFNGFRPLLDRISAAIDAYYAQRH
jgi:RNA-directed DNA polymerase